MGYFNELPNIAYQSPLLHKNSSTDYIVIKNIFRRTKLFDYLKGATTLLNKYYIRDGERPDIIAEKLYGDSRLDYIVILVANLININHEWTLRDHQVYDYALSKYGSVQKMNEIKYYETFEIRDDKERQILPPNLIVDADFKIDGTVHKFPSTSYTLRSQAGYSQLDDKDEYTVLTDKIARAVTNLEFEYSVNREKSEIDVLDVSYLQTFINDLRSIVKYEKSSNYISSSLAVTENTNVISP